MIELWDLGYEDGELRGGPRRSIFRIGKVILGEYRRDGKASDGDDVWCVEGARLLSQTSIHILGG